MLSNSSGRVSLAFGAIVARRWSQVA